MVWQVIQEGEGVRIAVVGDLDLYGAPPLARCALEGIAGGWRRVVLDASQMDYLDSTGVGVIIRMLQALKAVGGSMTCRGLHGTPRKVLEMSNILPLLREDRLPGAHR